MQRKHLWLCVPPIIVCLFDNAMTLWNQPADYWAGEFWMAHEAAPHGLWLLKRHPLAFAGGMLSYICIFSFVIVYLPRVFALLISTALVLGHTVGACIPIAQDRPLDGYWLSIGVCVIAAVLLVASQSMMQPPPRLPEPGPVTHVSVPARELSPYREPFSTN
jgi:hypothetical protein